MEAGPHTLRFPSLEVFDWLLHGFVGRAPAVPVDGDKAEVLRRLALVHLGAVEASGGDSGRLVTAEQVHGARVAVLDAVPDRPLEGCDGLVTACAGLVLGIHVADCCPVYLADPDHRAVALLHSGRRGTELGIAAEGVRVMREAFGSRPERMTAQLGPCIRPPHYEVDFAAGIVSQLGQCGVGFIHDCGLCTASAPGEFYSYRLEMGRTGRMLAFAAIR